MLTSGELPIKKSLDIEGPSAGLLAVSGNDKFPGLRHQRGNTVTIAGLAITHGHVVGNNGGGAILNSGGTLTLANDTFSDNVAIGNFSFGNVNTLPVGGGYPNRNNSTLTVTHCTFLANKPRREDGGGNAWGGGLSNDSGSTATVTVARYRQRGHRCNGGRSTSGQLIIGHGEGGGIANFATCTVENCTFTANLAVGGSGCTGDTRTPDSTPSTWATAAASRTSRGGSVS